MTGLWVTLGIVAFLALLLAAPVHVYADYEETLSLKIRYLFIPYRVLPQKEKPEKPQKEKKKKKAEEEPEQEHKTSKIQEILKEKGLSGFLTLMKELGEIGLGAGKKILSHTRISQFRLWVAVSTGDAADTAITYGQTCAVLYPVCAMLIGAGRCRKRQIDIRPDFNGKESRVSCSVRLRISLGVLLGAGFVAAFRGFRVLRAVSD